MRKLKRHLSTLFIALTSAATIVGVVTFVFGFTLVLGLHESDTFHDWEHIIIPSVVSFAFLTGISSAKMQLRHRDEGASDWSDQ